MKHTAYKIRDKVGCITWFQPHRFLEDKILEQTPLYTAHEIADFVKGLYFDDSFIPNCDKSVFAEIADKIEEESQKVL